ncbi:MAG: polysaccharide deacetylase family protein [Anaerolineae bacterium]|nr:polysaccharide deacetylase family protein [Anaerolineae bacterium]
MERWGHLTVYHLPTFQAVTHLWIDRDTPTLDTHPSLSVDRFRFIRIAPNEWFIMIDRRRAMKTMAVGVVGLASLLPSLGSSLLTGGPQHATAQTPIHLYPVPPSLMLHSSEGINTDDLNGFLPVLIRHLQHDGYQGFTYSQWLTLMMQDQSPPAKPIIVSIDDLTMAKGGPTFSTFVAMHDIFIANNFPITLAVVNRLDLPQDPERWAIVRGWVDEGNVELASHTNHHINFNNRDGSPRTDLTSTDYDEEIAVSALHIGDTTGIPVRTLITPYGSGFERSTQTIHPAVVKQCQEVGIKYVVGLPDGRRPIQCEVVRDTATVIYLGRTKPPTGNKTANGVKFELNLWYEHDYAPYLIH